MFETIMTFYGAVAEMAASGNGKKPHSENGKKVSYSGNGKNGKNDKKEDTKVKQPLNG
jgi:hypothetical protein